MNGISRGRRVSGARILAERAPAREGDEVSLWGKFPWNEKDGLVHGTHRDPDGGREGGLARHRGQEYR